MLKVLLIQENGRHEENRIFRECLALKEGFVNNGVQAEIWGKGHANFEYPPDFNSFDILFNLEQYSSDWIPNSRESKPLKLYWAIDIHVRGLNEYWKLAKDYDFVLHSTKGYILPFKSIIPGAKHLWFPNAVDERFFYNMNKDRMNEIIFVGSDLPERKAIISTMQKEVGMRTYFKLGHEMVDLIRTTKIHFNKNLATDINYRTFETIGLGTCLLTNYDTCLQDLGFVNYENCLLYNSTLEAIQIAKNILSTDRWMQIGYNGSILAKEHTYTKRIRKLLEQIL